MSVFNETLKSNEYIKLVVGVYDIPVGKLHLDSMLERVWCSLASTCFRWVPVHDINVASCDEFVGSG